MSGGFEEAEEAGRGDDGRPRIDERVELERLGVEKRAVEDHPDPSARVVHDGERGDGAGSDAEPLEEPPGAREGEPAEAEGVRQGPEVERPVGREDDEPRRAAPLLEEEVLAVAPGHVRRRDLRLGDGEDGVVVERPRFHAELREEGEEARRVVRGRVRCVGSHRRDSEPAGRGGV